MPEAAETPTGSQAFRDDDEALAGADALARLADARVGWDASTGTYGVFFYKGEEETDRMVGFASPREATETVPVIRARAVLDAAEAIWEPAGQETP